MERADGKEAGGGALPEGMEMFCILMVVVTHPNVYTHVKTHWVHFLVCILNFNKVDFKRLKKYIEV